MQRHKMLNFADLFIFSLFVRVVLLFVVNGIKQVQGQRICNVIEYGAKGDNVTINTQSIQSAINDCSSHGGGIVLFPDNSGVFSSGSIFLDNNIILHIGENTTLSGVWPGWNQTWIHYPKMYTRANGFMGFAHASLVNGGYCLQLSSTPSSLGDQCLNWKKIQIIPNIKGPGTIDGVGYTWWTCSDTCPDGCDWNTQRPTLLGLLWIDNLLIQNVHIANSPFWTTHPTFCNNVTVINTRITAPSSSHNTDGFDPDSCSNVVVRDTLISVGDDCVAINSGKNEDGVIVGIPAVNHTFINVTCLSGHGMSIGSGMSGNVSNILFKNCTCDGSNTCPRIKTALGRGGYVYNVTYEDFEIRNMQAQVLEINMYYPYDVNDTLIPYFSNITMRNFNVGPQKGKAGLLLGLKEAPITNLILENIIIDSNEGWECEYTFGNYIDVSPPIKCNNTI